MEKVPGTGENPNAGVNVQMLKDAEDVVCEECGSEVFHEVMQIKKISKFLTGSKADSIAPMPVIACAKCNHVNKLFKPDLG